MNSDEYAGLRNMPEHPPEFLRHWQAIEWVLMKYGMKVIVKDGKSIFDISEIDNNAMTQADFEIAKKIAYGK